jgi:hypothetical protein
MLRNKILIKNFRNVLNNKNIRNYQTTRNVLARVLCTDGVDEVNKFIFYIIESTLTSHLFDRHVCKSLKTMVIALKLLLLYLLMIYIKLYQIMKY